MGAHPTYFSYLSLSSDEQKIAAACLVGGALLLVGKRLTARLQTPEGLKSAVVPDEQFSLFGFFDLFIEGFLNFYDSILGKENRRHMPFVATVFFFLLASNLLGLIPGMPAITTTVWINVAMALTVFIYFNWQGIKANGVIGYLKHFAGPVWWLAWFMFPLEIFSTCLRILTLNLRLYWNISADHQVLSVFSDLLPPPLPVIFYVLGTFVAFMQAFVFTTLTMVYILLAEQHEEEH